MRRQPSSSHACSVYRTGRRPGLCISDLLVHAPGGPFVGHIHADVVGFQRGQQHGRRFHRKYTHTHFHRQPVPWHHPENGHALRRFRTVFHVDAGTPDLRECEMPATQPTVGVAKPVGDMSSRRLPSRPHNPATNTSTTSNGPHVPVFRKTAKVRPRKNKVNNPATTSRCLPARNEPDLYGLTIALSFPDWKTTDVLLDPTPYASAASVPQATTTNRHRMTLRRVHAGANRPRTRCRTIIGRNPHG